MSKVLDGIEATEFDQLMEQFIERKDPDAMSAESLDQAMRQQLEQVTTTRVELTGTIREGQIAFDPPADAPIIVYGNELVIGGLRLVVNLRPSAEVG
jgi:hypothetical protein